MPYKGTVNAGVAVEGWKELTNALHQLGGKSEFGIEYELQRRLRATGQKVAEAAPAFVTHRYPSRTTEPLESSVRVSVTRNQASVYSTSRHGGVQNVGGFPASGPGGRGPHVQRKNASKWMIRAVQSQKAAVRAELEGLTEWVVREFERGL